MGCLQRFRAGRLTDNLGAATKSASPMVGSLEFLTPSSVGLSETVMRAPSARETTHWNSEGENDASSWQILDRSNCCVDVLRIPGDRTGRATTISSALRSRCGP